jgi:hypothetical protein
MSTTPSHRLTLATSQKLEPLQCFGPKTKSARKIKRQEKSMEINEQIAVNVGPAKLDIA